VIGLIAAGASFAAGARELVPLTPECLDQAIEATGQPRLAMLLLLAQENTRVGACGPKNANGTVDCGPAGVNSNEVARLARDLGVPQGWLQQRVRDDGCLNVAIGALIFTEKLQAAGGETWDAMGRYNSATPVFKNQYQQELGKRLREAMAAAQARQP
jgi:hypothetical protein